MEVEVEVKVEVEVEVETWNILIKGESGFREKKVDHFSLKIRVKASLLC